MNSYDNVLIVIDLSADSSVLIERAQAVAGNAAMFTLMHVVEYVPMEPLGESVLPAVQVENALIDVAKENLALLAARHGLAQCVQKVTVGSIKAEIQHAAQTMQVDLLVVGNHERHGLGALFNFTEDAVLHSAPCDVLAVHLQRVKRA